MRTTVRIEELIRRFDSGEDVSRRHLFRAIGSTALAKMEMEWRKEVKSRGFKPPEIAEYAKRLGIALRKYGLVQEPIREKKLLKCTICDFNHEVLEEVLLTL
jgi:hypothetical protein